MCFLQFLSCLFLCTAVIFLTVPEGSQAAEPISEPTQVTPADKPSITTVQAGQPARVALVHSADPACGDSCPAWISIEGQLTEETETAFRAVLKKLGNHRLPVLIHSGGGFLRVGYAIGRMIRERHLDVGVARTVIVPREPADSACEDKCAEVNSKKDAKQKEAGKDDIFWGEAHSYNSFCASSCTFILAAGEHRFVAPWSHIGVHQILAVEKRVLHDKNARMSKLTPAEAQEIMEKGTVTSKDGKVRITLREMPSPATLATLRLYLKEMGIEPRLQTLMSETEPKSIHWMTHAELNDTALVTDYYGGETLLARSAMPLSDELYGPQPRFPLMHIRSTAGPELPVSGIAHALFQLTWTKTEKAKVLLEAVHQKYNPLIELNLVFENRAELNEDGTFAVAITFGGMKGAPSVLAKTPVATYPMTAHIKVEQFCAIGHDNYIKFKLAQILPEQQVSEFAGFLTLDRIDGMQQLVDDLCPNTLKVAPSLRAVALTSQQADLVQRVYRDLNGKRTKANAWQGLSFYPVGPWVLPN